MNIPKFSRLKDSRLIIGAVCILVSAALAFGILPQIYRSKNRTIRICRLRSNIPSGTLIEENMLYESEIGSYGLPEGVITDKAEILGKYSKTEISGKDLLFADRFAEYMSDARLDKLMAENMRLVTVSLDNTASGIANHLQKGDKVSVVTYKDDTKLSDIDPELQNMEVYDIETSDTRSVSQAAAEENETVIPATVTLIVTETQAKKLVAAEYGAKIHIVFERRGGRVNE